MQSEKMQIQLCPQLTAIQEQLKSVIANHQVVFRRYQNDPENAELRDKLEEMVLQIKNLSNHQTALVKQLREDVAQNTSTESAAPSPSPVAVVATSVTVTAAAAATPIIVTPSSVAAVAKPLVTLAQRPQLVTIQPHSIVVPLSHVQGGQAALMSLPGFLATPGTIVAPAAQSLVNLQLATTAASTAILTTPTLVSSAPAPNSIPAIAKGNNVTVKVAPPVPQLVQPRRISPPIKVPQYTANHPTSNQPEQANSGKASEKSNGVLHRSFSDSDTKDMKKSMEQTKDVRKMADIKNLPPEAKKKQDFMTCLGLVTYDSLKDLQNRRVERKRRSTANPNYSYTLELEKRRNGNYSNGYLMGGQSDVKRPRGRPAKPSPSPNNSRPNTPDSQERMCQDKREVCAECGKVGQLLLCGTCSLVYHLDCLSPPLAAPPPAPWNCPACIVSGKGTGTLSNGALTMVNSYIGLRANKQDERQRLLKDNTELLAKKQSLDEKKKAVKQKIEETQAKRNQLMESTNEKLASLSTLKSFVKAFQEAPVPPPSPQPDESASVATPTVHVPTPVVVPASSS